MTSAGQPAVTVVVPMYNAAATIERALRSALRQRDVQLRVIVVDHASTDDSRVLVARLAAKHPELELVELSRLPTDRKSPSRPLNVGLRAALAAPCQATHTWVFRLDADDMLCGDRVIADQLRAGHYRELIMAPLVFFDERARTCYEFGPRGRRRNLAGLRGRDVFAVAHHANAMRADLLAEVSTRGQYYDETLETGEDLGLTCALLSVLDGDASRFAYVDQPYCDKALDKETITGSLPLRRVLAAHRVLLRQHDRVSFDAVLRGLVELGLSRLVGEGAARRSTRWLLGRNGQYRAADYLRIEQRLRELRSDPDQHAPSDTAS